MTVLPQWLKKEAKDQRQMRRGQRRITSEEARSQYKRVEKESAASRSISRKQNVSLCALGQS
jgi:hypothetical protein